MLALTVFAHTLSFFRSRALLEISDQSGAKVADDDIRWIITVPAIWHEPAKQFMRLAAYQVRTLTNVMVSPDILVFFVIVISVSSHTSG